MDIDFHTVWKYLSSEKKPHRFYAHKFLKTGDVKESGVFFSFVGYNNFLFMEFSNSFKKLELSHFDLWTSVRFILYISLNKIIPCNSC